MQSKYNTRPLNMMKTCAFIAIRACMYPISTEETERARANVVLDSRSIRARKPLFYANLTTHPASNKLFARSSPFMDGTEKDRYRGPSPFVRTICRSRRRKYDQIFVANKAHGRVDKYLSNVIDTPTNLHPIWLLNQKKWAKNPHVPL